MPNEPQNIPETSAIRGIKYLSCQGGGMKGIGYVGAIRELDNLGVLPQLEEVAGSSAGGFLALMLAIGCTPEELEAEMLGMDFRSFQDKRNLGWIEASKIKQLLKGGEDLLGGSPEKIGKLVKVVSGAEKIEDVAGLALGSELGLWEGEALTHYLANLVARKTGNPNITFAELAALAKANGSPFKKLILTGSNLKTGKLEYYSAEDTPDRPIIQAARISASFPGAYKPVILEDGDERVDGGLLENLPDVFNKPPYLTPDATNEKNGNKYAFALSFTSAKEKEKPEKITSLVGLGLAMYSAKMTEAPLAAKYGDNIAFIDTVGMGTLDFDATDAQKQLLIGSGVDSVKSAFQNILIREKEAEIAFNRLPIEELMRIKVALIEKNKENINIEEREKNKEILVNITKELSFRVENKIISKDHDSVVTYELLEKLENAAEKKFAKKKIISEEALSEQQLSEICLEKRQRLAEVTLQLTDDLRQLELSKAALELDREYIVKKYKENDFNNDIVKELNELKRLEDAINKYLPTKMNQENESETLLNLKTEKEKLYAELIKKYAEGDSKDTALAALLKDIRADSEKSSFKIPTSEQELRVYCLKDIQACETYIRAVKREFEVNTSETNVFLQYKPMLKEKNDKASSYSSLIRLNTELDKNIKKRTTLLTKTNHYLLKKAPKFERAILGFSKAVAFVSFVTWLPLGIPAVTLAKAASHFSSSPEAKATAEGVIDFFKLTDVDSDHRLRRLRDQTSKFVKKMNEDYAYADKSEITYLHKLHELYLEKSGLKIEDIFVKNPGESLEEYKERIVEETAKLYRKTREFTVIGDTAIPNMAVESPSRVAENFENFKKIMVRDVNTAIANEAEMLKIKKIDPKSREARNSRVLKKQLALKVESEQYLHEQILRSKVKKFDEPDRVALQSTFLAKRKKHHGVAHGKVQDLGDVESTVKSNKPKKPRPGSLN
ncbi:MAG TPA: patatin-like phospholipase family protein [Gammaproteobacteria bacterium]|nr:patatin-like phospholipase family protein [Gammaproteobacteria bacterium]